MSEGKLTALPSGPGGWAKKSDEDARQTLETILADYDRFVVVGIRRTERGGVEWTYSAGACERNVTSALELTGRSLHVITRDLEEELGT